MSCCNNYGIFVKSKNNNLYIYYEKSALYCKMINSDGDSKETLLISGIYNDYRFSKSEQDDIYLLCHSKNNNFLLLTYRNDVWNIEELDFEKDSSIIIPIEIFALSNGIHIIFAKKLFIEHYYDLYLLTKNNNNWKKTFICEIYSKTINNSKIITMTNYNNLHMASTFFDGNSLSLNYLTYDTKNMKWLNIPILNLNQNKVYIYLLSTCNNINLFCYDYNASSANIFYFSKELTPNSFFKLVDIIKLKPINDDTTIIFEVSNEILKFSYVLNKHYYYKEYNIDTKEWITSKIIPIHQLPQLYWIKTERTELICSIDDNLEIALPIDTIKTDNSSINKNNKKASDETSIILEHINFLSEKIEALSSKLNTIEEEKKETKSTELEKIESKKDDKYHLILKKSNFKEKFMQSKPTTLKLENTALLYDKNEFKEAFPINKTVIVKNNNISDITHKDKENKQLSNKEQPIKSKNLIKTVTDWFKS